MNKNDKSILIPLSEVSFVFPSLFHVIAQNLMVAQILMIIAKIQDDNHHLFMNLQSSGATIIIAIGTMNDTIPNTMEIDEIIIHISGSLWYMLVTGYFLPVFTFFVVTYFWVQEFPIGVCIDCISIVEMPGIDEVMNLKKTREEKRIQIDRIKGLFIILS